MPCPLAASNPKAWKECNEDPIKIFNLRPPECCGLPVSVFGKFLADYRNDELPIPKRRYKQISKLEKIVGQIYQNETKCQKALRPFFAFLFNGIRPVSIVTDNSAIVDDVLLTDNTDFGEKAAPVIWEYKNEIGTDPIKIFNLRPPECCGLPVSVFGKFLADYRNDELPIPKRRYKQISKLEKIVGQIYQNETKCQKALRPFFAFLFNGIRPVSIVTDNSAIVDDVLLTDNTDFGEKAAPVIWEYKNEIGTEQDRNIEEIYNMPCPSAASNPKAWKECNEDPIKIFNLRPPECCGLPVSVFGKFLADYRNDELPIPKRRYKQISKLEKIVGQIYQNETKRQKALRPFFAFLFNGIRPVSIVTDNSAIVDDVLLTDNTDFGEKAAPIVKHRKYSCCPSIVLAIAGPWICVLRAIYLEKPVIELLTDFILMMNRPEDDGIRVKQLATLFEALRLAYQTLDDFYKNLSKFKVKKIRKFFPY
ncbi:15491_t:CDS:2, partial [Entrophospora sp. SA101]